MARTVGPSRRSRAGADFSQEARPVDDIKRTYREGEEKTKEASRERDGHDVGDDVGNAGDEVREGLGNAGDTVRKDVGKAGDEVRKDMGNAGDDLRRDIPRPR
jgi:hypothetical protein